MSGTFPAPQTADVLVIGGGVIGCSIALRLAQARLSVLVLDRGEPGREASSAAAGMIAPQGELTELGAFSDLCVASRNLYVRFVAEVEEASGQKVGYRQDGCLLVAGDEKQAKELNAVYRAQSAHGFSLEIVDAAEIHRRVPGLSPAIQTALFVPGDHWVDNERLMRALVEACQHRGVKFQSGQAANRVHVEQGRVVQVEAISGSAGPKSSYSAASYILAAGSWSGELSATLQMRVPVQPCRGQLLEFDSPEELPLVIRSGHLYMVPRPERRVVAGTTVEYVGFEKAVTAEGLRSVLEGLARLAPRVNQLRFRRAWAGFRPDTPDHLPILGYGELENLVFATGHFRNGILLAPITAQLISELVLAGSTSLPMESYRPTRFA